MSVRSRAGFAAAPLLLFMAACAGSGAHAPALPHHGGLYYHDVSGWVIGVPAGWHVLPFRSSARGASATGVQVSNVKLAAPSVVPSFPIQVSGKALPETGMALIIAADNDRRLCHSSAGAVPCPLAHATLPLPYPYKDGWNVASEPNPNGPLFSDLWFKSGHRQFIATLTIGARVFNDSHLAVLGKILASLRPARA